MRQLVGTDAGVTAAREAGKAAAGDLKEELLQERARERDKMEAARAECQEALRLLCSCAEFVQPPMAACRQMMMAACKHEGGSNGVPLSISLSPPTPFALSFPPALSMPSFLLPLFYMHPLVCVSCCAHVAFAIYPETDKQP